jgi:hypothetical protein
MSDTQLLDWLERNFWRVASVERLDGTHEWWFRFSFKPYKESKHFDTLREALEEGAKQIL